MASRSSGAGAIVALVLLGVTTLTFFVLTLYFYGQLNSNKAAALDAQEQLNRFVASTERDQAARLAEQYRGNTVFAAMSNQLSEAKTKLFGQPQGNMAEVDVALEELGVQDRGTSLLDIVRRLAAEVRAAEERAETAEQQFARAVKQLDDAKASYVQNTKTLSDTTGRVGTVLGQATSSLESYRTGLETEQAALRTQLEDQRNTYEQRINELGVQLQQKDREIAIAQDQIRSLRGNAAADRFAGANEATLVDGAVLSTSAGDGTITIDKGRRHRVVLGMQFEVYQSASVLRLDEQGNLPRSKGKIEVINVNETTSICRVLTELRGNPVVRGDVVVNPLYDPNKQYKFFVFGNFAPEGTEANSLIARDALIAQIRAWGGQVVQGDDLPGDLDFLVLGSRPVLPPEPGSGAPIEVRMMWVNARNNLRKYDELYNKATATSVPILNYNRLKTLLD